jgi:hypothetical protein
MKTTTTTTAARLRHHAALASLYKGKRPVQGLSLWRKLRRLEAEAHSAATAQCNGAAYKTQPFRPDWHPDGSEGTEENPTPWEIYAETIRARVAAIFGEMPQGFQFNLDARGYALKLDPDRGLIPDGMRTDWGGNGILAAEID